MRTKVELLKILLKCSDYIVYGLCHLAEQLYWENIINGDELLLISSIIRQNPTYFKLSTGSLYFFPIGEIDSRKEYLVGLILKYS